MGAAIQLNRLGYDNLAIIDREDDLGGTWHVNHYPGLTVDVPSTTYSYWFEPNPYWSRLYAPGAELKRYADHVADKYNLRRYMRFNTIIDGARWDEDADVWVIDVAGGETLTAKFLIAATGYLSQPKMPDIPASTTSRAASCTRRSGTTATRWRAAGGRRGDRIDRRATHSRTRQTGFGPDGLSAHGDLGAAQDGLRFRSCSPADVRPAPGHTAGHPPHHRQLHRSAGVDRDVEVPLFQADQQVRRTRGRTAPFRLASGQKTAPRTDAAL